MSTQDFFRQHEFPHWVLQGSICAPVVLNPAPQVRHLWLTPRLGAKWLWFPHSWIVNSPK